MHMDIVVMSKCWWAEMGTSSAFMAAVKLALETQFCVMPIVNNKAGKLLQTKGMSSLPWPSTDDSWCWRHTNMGGSPTCMEEMLLQARIGWKA